MARTPSARRRRLPRSADTFTKIVGTHSLKAGFYWDTQENLQANGSDINGNYDFETWGASSTYNLTLDRLMGRPLDLRSAKHRRGSGYHVASVVDLGSGFVEGHPQADRQLSVSARIMMGQWYDKIGGTQVWDPATYVNTPTPPANTGLAWHKINSSVPNSGWKSQLFFYDPRLGAAYDVFGTGRTVVRAGFGTYRYQVSSNDASGAMDGPLGSFDYNTSQPAVSMASTAMASAMAQRALATSRAA